MTCEPVRLSKAPPSVCLTDFTPSKPRSGLKSAVISGCDSDRRALATPVKLPLVRDFGSVGAPRTKLAPTSHPLIAPATVGYQRAQSAALRCLYPPGALQVVSLSAHMHSYV